MPNATDPVQLLQENGLRATPQRRTVLEVIATHGRHLSAEDVYREARRLNPDISLATVYRALAALRDAGLIQHSYSDRSHDRSHFEAGSAPEHFHFNCLGCGAIIEFESRHIDSLRRQLADEHAVEVTQACMCLSGYCKKCATHELPRNS